MRRIKRLEILLKAGIRLPLASAVLAVLLQEFAIYDWRVREQIEMNDITERKMWLISTDFID